MTTAAPVVTPRVRKAARLLKVAIYIQITLATAALLADFALLYLASLVLVLAVMFGYYRCRRWRQKWERTRSLDERETVLYLRARSKALSTLNNIIGPILVIVALVGLYDSGSDLTDKDRFTLPAIDASDLVSLFLGLGFAIGSLPILFLIEGEAADADEAALDELVS